MNKKKLCIYYDDINDASNMYLKYLLKDCKSLGIEYYIVSNFDDFKQTVDIPSNWKVLPMLPVKDTSVINWLSVYTQCDIDNVSGESDIYTSATAQGIFNFITENAPSRCNRVAVIGRGNVGKPLIDMLINYGYTVYEFNSQTANMDMYKICLDYADFVVGLAPYKIFNRKQCKYIVNNFVELIDASNCFDIDNKVRCGKFTRNILLERVL